MATNTTRLFTALFLMAPLAGLPGCSAAADDDGELSDLEGAAAVVEVHPNDIWGQTLPADGAKLEVVAGGSTRSYPVKVTRIGLGKVGKYTLRLSATAHEKAEVRFVFDGESVRAEAAEDPQAAPGVSVAKLPSADKPTHALFVGLRHQFFSAEARPARRGNELELLLDGEQAWTTVKRALDTAKTEVDISTWWWESDFELARVSGPLTESARTANTILGILQRSPARKRILVGQFWGQDSVVSWMSSDRALRKYADTRDDNIELMGQGNPTKGRFNLPANTFRFGSRVEKTPGATFLDEPLVASSMPTKEVDTTAWPVGLNQELGSYHQKFMVVDHDTTFIGGMNLRRVDWDSSAHRVFDERRMLFGASDADRQAVAAKTKLPDNGPRKDYILRVHGPAAQDAADVFATRWNRQMDDHVAHSEYSTRMEVTRGIPAAGRGVQVQVTATLPAPFNERAIGETWFNAVRHAQRYIYIEDQYFRMPMVVDAIVKRMQEVPTLRLLVITKPVSTMDPGCLHTAKSHERLRGFGARYAVLKLAAFDSKPLDATRSEGFFADMDVHSKMLIVDDIFMSVGSANKNNRGILYEAELNVAVYDASWVRTERARILQNILGKDAAEDPAKWFEQLQTAAVTNDAAAGVWSAASNKLDTARISQNAKPVGFAYSLQIPASTACRFTVGEDTN